MNGQRTGPGSALGRSEADVLAGMMGADSRRVDVLVSDVAEVKGDVRALRGGMEHVTDGIGELRGAMAILSRHSVLMETNAAEMAAMRASHGTLETRVRAIELDVPGLREARSWIVRGALGVVGLVCLAVIGLVIKAGV